MNVHGRILAYLIILSYFTRKMEVSQFLTLRKSVELNIANYFMTACLIKMRIQYDQNEGIYFSYLCSLCLYNCIYFMKYFDVIFEKSYYFI